ncbi:hypothetical protein [Bacillus manliponensis]|uniref:hypothetical protein n=1 Tax=Bacillus manliponensis TaxID=574376 RepID=UPI003519032C
MKKLQTFLVCGTLSMGLVACNSSEETKEVSKKVEKSVESKQEEKVDDTSIDSNSHAAEFKKLAPEMQLAVYRAFFHDVITSYDYGIGNPEYLLKDVMTQAEIDAMKEKLQEIKDAEKDGLLQVVHDTRTYLAGDSVSNVNDKMGLQKMFTSEDKIFQFAADMIACLDSVTVENASEKRAEMNTLKEAYVAEAHVAVAISKEVAKNSGMNVDKYVEAHTKLIKQ